MDSSVSGPQSRTAPLHAGTIDRQEILDRLDHPSLVLINVMSAEAFRAGHIPRSINLPVAEIKSRARDLFPHLERELTVYCTGPT